MPQPGSATRNAAPDTPPPELRLHRPKNAYVALGLAVSYLMTKPAFAMLRFGDWSRILVGQINRKHYCFVVDNRNQVQGFVGWAVTTTDAAEAWLQGRSALSYEQSLHGDCIIFNAWAANSLRVNRFLLREARKIAQGKDTVYFKRHYKDGTTRPARLRVTEFVARHIERNERLGDSAKNVPGQKA